MTTNTTIGHINNAADGFAKVTRLMGQIERARSARNPNTARIARLETELTEAFVFARADLVLACIAG
jgi:hypothetical protein